MAEMGFEQEELAALDLPQELGQMAAAEGGLGAMAEEETTAAPQAVDDDILPDDVEPENSNIPIFENLDEGNLVEQLDDIPEGRSGVSSRATQGNDEATESMSKWKKTYDKALKLAKLDPETKKKTFPFEGASTVMMPFIMQAMLDFHSRVVPELVWAKNVVRNKTYGTQTEDKLARAIRTADYMNWQVTEEMPNWRPEADKMMLALPCVGTAYKKSWWNGDEQKVRSDMHHGDEIKFDCNYKTFDDAPEYFMDEEYTRNEVIGFIRGDAEWDMKEEDLPPQKDHPKPFEFLRAYMWIDLDEDGLEEPYEVVVYKETEAVVSVYPAYEEEDVVVNDDGEIVEVEMARIFTQYRFLPDPEGGPMGMGWGILLCDLFDSLNTTVRQMIDAGTLANLAGNSGLIDMQMSGGSGRGNRVQTGPIEVRMGELTPVTTGGKPLGQSVVQFPYSGPNQALFELTKFMEEQVRVMTNAAYNMDTNSQEAAMMYLARLQQGLKVPNSIVMRVYNSAREEFNKIARLNYIHYSDEKYNKVIDQAEPAKMRADFNPDDCDIRPAIDPSQGSDIERQQRAQIILDAAKEDQSGTLNIRQAYLDWLEALKVDDIESLAPEPSGEPDPMQELLVANMQRQAELEERGMAIQEARLELDRAEQMMKALKEGAEYGLEFDKTEAEIADLYASAFKKLWEIGMQGDDVITAVENIETRLIDKKAGAAAPALLESPASNPQQQAAPPQGGPPPTT